MLTDLPNVIGMSIDEAKRRLGDAGFEVSVGEPVDSNAAEGTVAAQNPGAGRVAGGTTVTISPSNGNGAAVPGNVAGRTLSEAISYLQSVGFGDVQPGTCVEEKGVKGEGQATGTNPPAGTSVNRNATILVDYKSAALQPVTTRIATHRPHRARRGGGGRARRGRLGHRHRAVPLHPAAPRAAAPARRARSPSRVLHLSDAHMAPWQRRKQQWIASLAALEPDLVVNTGDNLGHELGLRGLRRAFDPLRGIPGVFVHGSNDHTAPSPRNPLKYFTGPSDVPVVPEPLDTRALDTYLTEDLGWIPTQQRRRPASTSRDCASTRSASATRTGNWDRLDALPDQLDELREHG